jgi:hypothetical protein
VLHHIINNFAGALYKSSIKHKNADKTHTLEKYLIVEHYYSGGNERENSVVFRRLQKTDNDGEYQKSQYNFRLRRHFSDLIMLSRSWPKKSLIPLGDEFVPDSSRV